MLLEMMNYLIESSQDFTTALSQHLYLTFVSLAISILLGLLAGIIGTRFRSLKSILLGIGNIGRTIPSLAVLALALPFLGIGTAPTVFALVFIGTLPVMINTTVGIEQVDPAIIEAARGMGMNDFQVLTKVELPIASAVILAGIRTSAVVVVASATLAAFIGGGGLGDLILRGHALNRDYIMLAGAIPAILLAFYFEETFGRLQNWATPKGLKIEETTVQSDGLLGLLAAVALLPLVFGMLLPWNEFMTPDGPVVLTGLHEEYRLIGVPVLILGLLAAMWPRSRSGNRSWKTAIIPEAFAVAALLWLLINIPALLASLQPGQTLQYGFYIQAGAVILLVAITSLELVRSWRESENQPAELELVQEGGVALG
jgi:osmoprotectant transport system permease protein